MSDLVKQLSLSENGGVYFEGTRVNPTQDPIVFVGLGGTGIDALLRIKNEVQTRMPLPKDDTGKIIGTSPANIGFLAIDTAKQAMEKSYGIAEFDKNGDEFVNISVDGLPKAISAVVEQTRTDDVVWSWFDRDINGNGGVDGANGIRQVGRFMLIQNIKEIKSKFEKTINRVLNAAKGQETTKLRIFVLTGIGGGTGSGTFIDVAYLLRKFGSEVNNNTTLFGYIFTPDLNKGKGGDQTSMYRNGFASLKELDYWMSIGSHGEHFKQDYSDTVRVDSNRRPFEYCHLITGRNFNGENVTYDEAMDSVAGDLFSFIVNEKVTNASGNTALAEMYDNIFSHIDTAVKKAPANYYFLSIGSDKIEIPYTEITTLVAARLIKKIQPMIDRAPARDEFAKDLFMLGLQKDQLVTYMKQNVIGIPSSGQTYKYSDIWPSNDPYQRDWRWLQEHATIKIRENASNLASVYEGKLLDYIQGIIKDPNKGPCYAAKLIYSDTSYSLIKTLEGFRKDCQERVAGTGMRINEVKERLSECFAAGRNAGVFGKGTVTKEYVDLLTQWIEYSFGYWIEADLNDGLAQLIERLNKYYKKIFGILEDTMERLPDIFEKNMTKLVSDEHDFLQHPEKAAKYLIRPLQYEKEFSEKLDKSMAVAVNVFGTSVLNDLKKWTGLALNEVDSEQPTDADVGGALADFIFTNFEQELSLNMQQLLMKDAGQKDMDTYLREKLDKLRLGAVPLYELSVEQRNRVYLDEFAMISIPNDCPDILRIASGARRDGETAKQSEELSRLQWVKVIAGIPIFALPGVAEMEELYEKAMQGGTVTRRGVHLRYDWRDHMPSPIPEMTWSRETAELPHKAYTKARNRRIREAFNKCKAAGAIRMNDKGEAAELFIADESILDNLDMTGRRLSDRKRMVEELKRYLWTDHNTAVNLEPYAPGNSEEDTWSKIEENQLRLTEITDKIEREAKIVDKYNKLLSSFVNVETFVNALIAGMIVKQGFGYRFKRTEFDPAPLALCDQPDGSEEYEIYKAMLGLLEGNDDLKQAVADQMQYLTGDVLLNPDHTLNTAACEEKAAQLKRYIEKFGEELRYVNEMIPKLPRDQRAALMETADFYENAMEYLEAFIKRISQ